MNVDVRQLVSFFLVNCDRSLGMICITKVLTEKYNKNTLWQNYLNQRKKFVFNKSLFL